jgi:hypothetical protein
VETSFGQFNWTVPDSILQANEAQGLDTLLILVGTPGQYQGVPLAAGAAMESPPIGGSFVRQASAVSAQGTCNSWDGQPAPSGLFNPIFADGSDVPAAGKAVNADNPWARFVHEAVNRYKPGGTAGLHIRHWEIWNEEDLCSFWSGTPQEYARLLKVAYLVIKQSDPEAVVIWGGLAHFANGNFLYEMLDALKADPMAAQYGGFFDAAGSHQYSLSYLGYMYTAKIRDALAQAGWSGKPIWITESGVPVCDDYPGPPCPSPWRARPLEQAAYIWQNYAYTRLAGGGPIFHFMLHDDCGNIVAVDSPDAFGLIKNESNTYCSPSNAEPRLAYTAYQLATRYFPGTELVWADIHDGAVRRVSFYYPPTRERRLLVWNLKATDRVGTIPAAGPQARLISLDGSESTIFPVDGVYEVPLPGATNRNWPNNQGGFDIGIYGEPFLLIEEDTTPPVTSISPLPPLSPPDFTVSWKAQDWGAGVASAALWMQVNNQGWQLWKADLPPTGSVSIHGTVGDRYQFALLAVDRLGHEYQTLAAQAETEITDQIAVTGTVVNVRGVPVGGVPVSIGSATSTTDDSGAFAMQVKQGTWDVKVGDVVVNHQRSFQDNAELQLLYAPAGNAVANGDFEAGLSGWTTGGSSPLAVEQQPGTGDHALHLATGFVPNPGVPGEGGSDGGNSTVYQRLAVPSGHPFLAFAYRVDSQETEAGHDWFEVIIAKEGQPANFVLRQDTSQNWRYHFVDLWQYAGGEITLNFNVYQSSAARPTSAVVDLITISDAGPISQSLPHQIYLPTVQRH